MPIGITDEMGSAFRLFLRRVLARLFDGHRLSDKSQRRFYYGGSQFKSGRQGGSSPLDPDAPVLQPLRRGPGNRSSSVSVVEPEPDRQTNVVGDRLR